MGRVSEYIHGKYCLSKPSMAWRRRYIQSGSVYEICFRARKGIPLPPNPTVNFLVECSLAWALRNDPVKVCHMVVMGNHVHLMVVAFDPEAFVRFYGEFMKRLTDSIKHYVGIRHLRLWESRAMVALVADEEACKNRIAYFYLNPARAHLAHSIDTYTGVSSWRALKSCSESKSLEMKVTLPSITMPDIRRAKTSGSDKMKIKTLKYLSKSRPLMTIRYFPFAWMEVFGINGDEVEKTRERIIKEVRGEETKLETERQKIGRKIFPARQLETQRPLSPFTPRKYQRRVFILSTLRELRASLIQHILKLDEKCVALYQKWKLGHYPDEWPLGMFKPNPPMLAALIA